MRVRVAQLQVLGDELAVDEAAGHVRLETIQGRAETARPGIDLQIVFHPRGDQHAFAPANERETSGRLANAALDVGDIAEAHDPAVLSLTDGNRP